ncbi:arginase [Paenibacillus caseinilyticus]|uniref:Arginase n=1 Tax=Paenibacillus mucilaginosus K02 TaxID=997761 RepID=I0BPW6_9BACL|nr:arginase [Paenibacillus mucilaginosus]AFH64413.1 arginase [Paenibacillus mucilaginosus K02]
MSAVKDISVLCVPFDLGAGRKGVRLGPHAILQAGLERRLRGLGLQVEVLQPFPVPQAGISEPAVRTEEALLHLDEVAGLNELLAQAVWGILGRGRFPLVLGGDHSIAIGTLAGIAPHHKNPGVIWFDAHSDLNTPETSPSGNIHGMSLAAALGLGHDRLVRIGGITPKVKPEHTVIIGARSLDPGEKERIRSLGIRCFTMHEIDRMGISRVMEEALHIAGAGTDGIHVSFDIDSMDPGEAPGTGTPVRGGLSYREAHCALEMLSESGLVRSAEVVEVNPVLDTDNKTARLAAELMGSLLGQRIL